MLVTYLTKLNYFSMVHEDNYVYNIFTHCTAMVTQGTRLHYKWLYA